MPLIAVISIAFGYLAADRWLAGVRSTGAVDDPAPLLVIVCAAASAGALLGPLP